MKLFVEELPVLFPYDYIYPEQYQYMLHLKATLDGSRGHCLLEMPTGTGKTITLLSFILAYQYAYPTVGKLVYCTRTVQEMDKVVAELRRVMRYRWTVLGEEAKAGSGAASSSAMVDEKSEDIESLSQGGASQAKRHKPNEKAPSAEARGGRQTLGVCLSSRLNMCIHPEVNTAENRDKVDALCRNRTASFVRERRDAGNVQLCDFYEGFLRDGSDASISGIYSLEDMKELGRERQWCPYFLARRLINMASVVVYNYQYLLDPKISNMVSREIENESIVVFDEAHNIDNVCIEALSVVLDKQVVLASSRNVKTLERRVKEMERSDAQRLNEEYRNLVQGLRASGVLGGGSRGGGGPAEAKSGAPDASDQVISAPVLDADILREAMPGNIRRARHFVRFLHTVLEYLRQFLRRKEVTRMTPADFVSQLQKETGLADARALRFTYDRLSSLLKTLQVTDIDEFTPVTMVANFATLVATYSKGFTVLFEPYDDRTQQISDPILQLACLDSALAMRPVFGRFRNVIITSGTLSPLDFYPKILGFRPKLAVSLTMSLARNCICPLVVTRGSDQVQITTLFRDRGSPAITQNYGLLVTQLAEVVPDGMVCFFPSYSFMEEVVMRWEDMGLLKELSKSKLVFIETKDIAETQYALEAFRKACDCGRGAIFLSVARGKVAEGIDFDGHYGRAVVLIGVPFQYTLKRVLTARLEFLRDVHQISEGDFLSFDAMRQAAQCAGRVIRSKQDYGLMVFADARFNRVDKRRKLPAWITQFLEDRNLNLSTDQVILAAKEFFRTIVQPRSRDDDQGFTLLTEEQVLRLNRERRAPSAAAAAAGVASMVR